MISTYSQHLRKARRYLVDISTKDSKKGDLLKVTVIADDRERQCGVIQALNEMEHVETEVRRLELGDYLAGNRLLIERKTLKDFAISLIDGRLFSQVARLALSDYESVLILEGEAKAASEIGVRREAIQGAIITLSLILGTPILRSKDPRETARLIIYSVRQLHTIAHGAIRRGGGRPKGKKKRQLFLLQGLPGIGRERAKLLLDSFGSVEAVMNATNEELQSVEGIGKGTAEKIRWAVT